jgi:predicted negative regulator of RcsB-dependent stress response
MTYRKRKITHIVKKPDEFISTMESITLFVENNIKVILAITAGVIAIGLAILAFNFYSSHVNKKASALEYQAMRHYYENSADGYKKAVELLEEVVKLYPNSKTAKVAQYNIGNAYFKMNDLDKAEGAYKKFIDGYSSDKILLSLVMQKLSYVYIAKKDYNMAIENLNKIISNTSFDGKDQAYFELGRLHETLNKKDDAVIKYEALVRDYSFSPWAAEGAARLKILKGEDKKEDKKK